MPLLASPSGRPPLLVGPALRNLVREASDAAISPVVQVVIETLRAELGGNLLGLIFYGSHLNSTAGPGSDHDFFVVLESYSRAHGRGLHALLNRILPPSIYHRSIPLPGGQAAGCKLCYVSAGDLVRSTSPRARDCYFFGRLGKRVAPVHWRDAGARDLMNESIARSVALCGGWALRGMPAPFSPDAFVHAALVLSYQAEERVEGQDRAKRLLSVDEAYYRSAYGAVLDEARRQGLVRPSRDEGKLELAGGAAGRRTARRAYERFLRRSRARARLRWLKNMWTFEGWTDYMIAKIERHQGVSIQLTPWERRHRLIAAARHYVRLRREGRVR